MKKYKIIIGSLLILVTITCILYKNLNKTESKFRGGTLHLQEHKTPPNEDPISEEIDLDSVFHKKICFDYKNIWVTYDESKKKYKIVLFEYTSGKVFIYNVDKSYNKSKLGVDPADEVLEWNFYCTPKDNKIIAVNGWDETQKDSLIYWIYDNYKNSLIDSKGLIYHKL